MKKFVCFVLYILFGLIAGISGLSALIAALFNRTYIAIISFIICLVAYYFSKSYYESYQYQSGRILLG